MIHLCKLSFLRYICRYKKNYTPSDQNTAEISKIRFYDVQNGHISRGWYFNLIKYALFDQNTLVLYGFRALQSADTAEISKIHSHVDQNTADSVARTYLLQKSSHKSK